MMGVLGKCCFLTGPLGL